MSGRQYVVAYTEQEGCSGMSEKRALLAFMFRWEERGGIHTPVTRIFTLISLKLQSASHGKRRKGVGRGRRFAYRANLLKKIKTGSQYLVVKYIGHFLVQ